jgi:hypothetical protein
MPDILQPQLQPDGGESGWLPSDGVCGANASVIIGLCPEQDRVISPSQTRQAILTLSHMLAAFDRSGAGLAATSAR